MQLLDWSKIEMNKSRVGKAAVVLKNQEIMTASNLALAFWCTLLNHPWKNWVHLCLRWICHSQVLFCVFKSSIRNSGYKLLYQQNNIMADHQIASHKHHFFNLCGPSISKGQTREHHLALLCRNKNTRNLFTRVLRWIIFFHISKTWLLP
jgi:hypothetical protein